MKQGGKKYLSAAKITIHIFLCSREFFELHMQRYQHCLNHLPKSTKYSYTFIYNQLFFLSHSDTSKDSTHMCNRRNMQQIYSPRAQEENKEVIWAGREDGNTINATQLSMRTQEDSNTINATQLSMRAQIYVQQENCLGGRRVVL